MFFKKWKKPKVYLIREPYWEEMEDEEQNAFLAEARALYHNAVLKKIINHLANLHFDRAALEAKNWEEVLVERSLGAGAVLIEQELEKLSFEYEERYRKKEKNEKESFWTV
jgi:hypothetical protein